MLNVYRLEQGRLVEMAVDFRSNQLHEAHWLEAVAPTPEEWRAVQSICALPLPEADEIDDLEASSNHLTHDQGFQVSSLFFHQLDGKPRNTNAAFLFDGEHLVSVCSRELPHFRLLRVYNAKGIRPLVDPMAILVALMDIKVDGLADEMEQAYRDLEQINLMVLGRQDEDLVEAVDGLALQEDLIGKVRLCLMDGQRDIRFMVRQPLLTKKYRRQAQELLLDIETLMPHNSFLSSKADFLLNAAQGFINMEQNRIMKIFSIVALVFLPPTLIAGIYGMNFHLMPELSWPWGYPMALGLMLLAGAGPYLYFKRKGWL